MPAAHKSGIEEPSGQYLPTGQAENVNLVVKPVPEINSSVNNIADIAVPYLPGHEPTGMVEPLHPAPTLHRLDGATL